MLWFSAGCSGYGPVTDLLILQDLLDAASKRGVAVYLLLEEHGLPHFLDMSNRLQISAQHLRVSENHKKLCFV